MGISLTCPGCGQPLEIAEEDPRPEVECLWCGRQFPVPNREPRAPAREAPQKEPIPVPPLEKVPVPSLSEPESIPSSRETIPVPFLPQPEPAPPQPKWHEQQPYGLLDEPLALQPLPPPAPKPEPAATAAPPPSRVWDDDDDGRPYQVDTRGEKRCPECGQVLPGEAVLCSACGYNMQTGEKGIRTYQPLERTWVTGWPLAVRKKVFFGCAAFLLPLAILTGVLQESATVFFLFGTFSILFVAFLLGTFNRVDLSRKKNGKVTLKNTWRFCFQERPAKPLRLGEYDGVTMGKRREGDFWDWMIWIFLLSFGPISLAWHVLLVPVALIPAALWGYYFIHLDIFYVALTQDRGRPVLFLYHGWSEEHMKDLHDTVKSLVFPGA